MMTEENWLLYEVLPISVREGELPKLKRWGGPFESRDFAVQIAQSAGKKFTVHGWAVAPMCEAQHQSYGPHPKTGQMGDWPTAAWVMVPDFSKLEVLQ